MTADKTDRIVVLASANKGKLKELQEMLGDAVKVVSAVELNVEMPEETESTFAGNAALKSKAAYNQTGHISLADDSGLEVDALNGEPGVYSARYAGQHATDAENNKKLLEAMANVPDEQRTARFRSAIAVSIDDGEPLVFDGAVEGSIGHSEVGSNGFGYDPLFRLPNGKSFGELTSAEKNPISHRGVAMSKAIPALMQFIESKDVKS